MSNPPIKTRKELSAECRALIDSIQVLQGEDPAADQTLVDFLTQCESALAERSPRNVDEAVAMMRIGSTWLTTYVPGFGTSESGRVAWEATSSGLLKFVSEEKYQGFSSKAKSFYKPFRCSACTTILTDQS